jgi:hypothetical protein
LANLIGTTTSAVVTFTKNTWNTLANLIGTATSAVVTFTKNTWNTLANLIGTATSAVVSFSKNKDNTLAKLIGTATSATVTFTKNKDNTLAKLIGTAITVTVNLQQGWVGTIRKWLGLSTGGVISQSGAFKLFSSGGRIAASGASEFWRSVPHYASGTSSAHGTAFVAGEAGPEVVGHIGGRTEVLNKSQLAATMYEAVTNGVGAIINAFSTALFNKLADCANGIISTLSYLSGVPVTIEASSIENSSLLTDLSELASRISYTAPVMSTGSVLPYSVAKSQGDADDITGAIEASNDDLKDVLVQAIASAAQLVASAVNNKNMSVNVDADSITQQTIDEINRRTLMFQASPLMEG